MPPNSLDGGCHNQLLHGVPIGLKEIDDGRAIMDFASLHVELIDDRKDRSDRLQRLPTRRFKVVLLLEDCLWNSQR